VVNAVDVSWLRCVLTGDASCRGAAAVAECGAADGGKAADGAWAALADSFNRLSRERGAVTGLPGGREAGCDRGRPAVAVDHVGCASDDGVASAPARWDEFSISV
jgi:hypothetical protein